MLASRITLQVEPNQKLANGTLCRRRWALSNMAGWKMRYFYGGFHRKISDFMVHGFEHAMFHYRRVCYLSLFYSRSWLQDYIGIMVMSRVVLHCNNFLNPAWKIRSYNLHGIRQPNCWVPQNSMDWAAGNPMSKPKKAPPECLRKDPSQQW